LGHTIDVYADALLTRFSYHRIYCKDGCRQGALQCRGRNRIFWKISVEKVEIFLEHVAQVTVIGQKASGHVLIPIQD
jgi:hypothetical protein